MVGLLELCRLTLPSGIIFSFRYGTPRTEHFILHLHLRLQIPNRCRLLPRLGIWIFLIIRRFMELTGTDGELASGVLMQLLPDILMAMAIQLLKPLDMKIGFHISNRAILELISHQI